MDVDGAQFDVAVMAPDAVEQALARKDMTGMLDEMLEQAKFGRAECDCRAVAAHPVRHGIDLDIGIAQRLAGERGADSAQHRLDAGDQLTRRKRLGDVIVGAGIEAADAVFLFAARGQHDDRDVGGTGIAAQPTAHFDARQILDHPVEQDDVGRLFPGEDQRHFAVGRMADGEVLARKMKGQQLGKRGIVLDQQHVGLRHGDQLAGSSVGFSPRSRSGSRSPVTA